MQKLFLKYNREILAYLFYGIAIVGLLVSRSMISTGMIGLIVSALLNSDIKDNAVKYAFFKPLPVVGFIANTIINPDYSTWFRRFFSYKAFPILTMIFFITLISGLWSEDTGHLFERLRIKLPFLALPFAIGSLIAFSKRQLYTMLYFFIFVMIIGGIGVMANYAMHFEEITLSVLKGKVIPTPFSHIRFSLMLCFAFVSGLMLIKSRYFLKWEWERYLIIGFTASLFVIIHILSVRSGLLALYVSLTYLIIQYVLIRKKYLAGIFILIGLMAIPIISYKIVPSFQNKVKYAVYDLKMYLDNTPKAYSDARRLVSIKVGMELGKQNPWIGVGAGDLKNEVRAYYKTHFPEITNERNMKLPHNQFVWVFASTGIIGLLLFLFANMFPLFYKRNYKNPLLMCFYIITFTSFLTEYTLETQLGTAFYSIFLLVILNYQKENQLNLE